MCYDRDMKNTKSSTIWSKDFTLLFLINNILFFGFQLIMPVFPKYAASLGAGDSVLGLISSVFPVAAFLVRPFAGRAADRMNRNLIQRVSLLGMSLIMFAYLPVRDVALLTVVRIVHGVFFGINQTTTSTMVALVLPEDRMSSGIGMFSIGGVVSMAIAPPVALWIVGVFGYVTLYISAGAISVAALAFAFFVSQQSVSALAGQKETRGNLFTSLIATEAAIPATVSLLNSFFFGTIQTFVVLHGEQRGVANVGIFFTAYAAMLLVVRVGLGRFSDRIKPTYILYTCSTLFSVSILLMWGMNSVWMLVASAVVYGLANGFSQPLLQTMSLRSVSVERRGVASSTHFMGVDLGIGVGPIFAGMVAAWFGYAGAFLSMLIPVGLAVSVLFIGTRRRATAQSQTLH